MNILVVKTAALGDVLRTTGLLRPLCLKYPGCRIDWLTQEKAKPLLEGHPLIGEILLVEDGAKLNSAGRYDLVLSMEEDAEAAALAARACRGELVGVYPEAGRLRYSASSASYYDMSLLHAQGGLDKANALKARNRRTYLELWSRILGVPAGTATPEIFLSPRDVQAARSLAGSRGLRAGRPVIGINPGAGRRWPAKQMSVAQTLELIGALSDRFPYPLLLLGGREEAERNREIVKKSQGQVIDAGCARDLRSFAGIVDLCALVITTDSLAFHVATALGKKTVALAGPTSAAELDVCAGSRKLAPRRGCVCYYQRRCRRRIGCMEEISAADIVAAAGDVLSAPQARQKMSIPGPATLYARLCQRGWRHKTRRYKKYFSGVAIVNKVNLPAVSVVVVSWKYEAAIVDNMRALAKQKKGDFEVIFVNNGGPEEDFAAIKPLVDVYVTLNSNTGACLSRNIGAVFARAPIILFVDDDAWPGENLVAAHRRVFERYDVVAVRGAVRPRSNNALNLFARHYYLGAKPFPVFADIEGNTSYDAEVFFQVGGWNDEMRFGGEGVELSMRLALQTRNFFKQIYSPEPVIYHDYAANEAKLAKKLERRKIARARLWREYPFYGQYLSAWHNLRQRSDLLIRRGAS